jgi:hypothetical protein
MQVNALMNWAVRLGEITANPFHYLDTTRYRKDENGKLLKKKTRSLKPTFGPSLIPHACASTMPRINTGFRSSVT